MTKLETAMRMRGMRPIDLAGKLGITRHNMGNYLHGIRALGPTMLPAAAGALGVSQAYLRGIADSLPVYDWAGGDVAVCPIMSETDIDGYGCYYIVEHPEVGWMAIIISAGIQFTPRDWQGAQPLSVEDIASTGWVDHMGRQAIMIDGLPRVFAG